jgi:hypothetical protein
MTSSGHVRLLWIAVIALAGLNAFQLLRPSELPREITVERINVIEPDGTLRVVVSNQARQADPWIQGRDAAFARIRPAGLIFFNNEGHEAGGLVFRGTDGNAGGSLTLDRYRQDQVVGLSYTEASGAQFAGLRIWDRPDLPMDEFLDRIESAGGPSRTQEVYEEMVASGELEATFERMQVGRLFDGSVGLRIMDSEGRDRVRLLVNPEGIPVLELLDESGDVIETE